MLLWAILGPFLFHGEDFLPVILRVDQIEGIFLVTCVDMYSFMGCGVVLSQDMIFFLLQSEYGDLYRVNLLVEGDEVVEINASYFDTVPPANSICVMRSGLLFVASEFGNQFCFLLLCAPSPWVRAEADVGFCMSAANCIASRLWARMRRS